MIATAKARGYITYDELNEVLPEQVTSEQIEDDGDSDQRNGHQRGQIRRGRKRASPRPPMIGEGHPARELGTDQRRWSRRRTLDRTDDPGADVSGEMGWSSCCRARARSPSPSASRPAQHHDPGLWKARSPSGRSPSGATELLDEAIMLRDVIDLETTFGAPMEATSSRASPPPQTRWRSPEPTPPPAAQPPRRARAEPPVRTAAAGEGRRGRRPARARRRRPNPRRPSPTMTRTRMPATCRSPRWRRRSSHRCWRRWTGSPTTAGSPRSGQPASPPR